MRQHNLPRTLLPLECKVQCVYYQANCTRVPNVVFRNFCVQQPSLNQESSAAPGLGAEWELASLSTGPKRRGLLKVGRKEEGGLVRASGCLTPSLHTHAPRQTLSFPPSHRDSSPHAPRTLRKSKCLEWTRVSQLEDTNTHTHTHTHIHTHTYTHSTA